MSLLLLLTAACQQAASPKLSYPATKTGTVVDDYFGTKVADPYRWMEDLDSTEVASWVAAENKATFAYLVHMPTHERFRQQITKL
jgi:prolyl oligopeptidase